MSSNSKLPTQGIDRITDFTPNQDIFQVSAAGFGGGLIAGASLPVDQFVIGSAAGDANDRFIFDGTTGDLWFDMDGTGATSPVQIATLSNLPALSNTGHLRCLGRFRAGRYQVIDRGKPCSPLILENLTLWGRYGSSPPQGVLQRTWYCIVGRSPYLRLECWQTHCQRG